jgi:hypothetical protein
MSDLLPIQAFLSFTTKQWVNFSLFLAGYSRELMMCRRLFWMTQAQIKVFQNFGDILFIDATFKTNIYGVPLVQCVVIDAFGHIRQVATALTVTEDQASYTWILRQLHQTANVRPRVTFSDRADAITLALGEVFKPPTIHLKYYLHIKNNITSKFPNNGTWSLKSSEDFMTNLSFVVYSTSKEAFQVWMNNLITKYSAFHELSSCLDGLESIHGQ